MTAVRLPWHGHCSIDGSCLEIAWVAVIFRLNVAPLPIINILSLCRRKRELAACV